MKSCKFHSYKTPSSENQQTISDHLRFYLAFSSQPPTPSAIRCYQEKMVIIIWRRIRQTWNVAMLSHPQSQILPRLGFTVWDSVRAQPPSHQFAGPDCFWGNFIAHFRVVSQQVDGFPPYSLAIQQPNNFVCSLPHTKHAVLWEWSCALEMWVGRSEAINDMLARLALENNNQRPLQFTQLAIRKWRVLVTYVREMRNGVIVPLTLPLVSGACNTHLPWSHAFSSWCKHEPIVSWLASDIGKICQWHAIPHDHDQRGCLKPMHKHWVVQQQKQLFTPLWGDTLRQRTYYSHVVRIFRTLRTESNSFCQVDKLRPHSSGPTGTLQGLKVLESSKDYDDEWLPDRLTHIRLLWNLRISSCMHFTSPHLLHRKTLKDTRYCDYRVLTL